MQPSKAGKNASLSVRELKWERRILWGHWLHSHRRSLGMSGLVSNYTIPWSIPNVYMARHRQLLLSHRDCLSLHNKFFVPSVQDLPPQPFQLLCMECKSIALNLWSENEMRILPTLAKRTSTCHWGFIWNPIHPTDMQ